MRSRGPARGLKFQQLAASPVFEVGLETLILAIADMPGSWTAVASNFEIH